MAYSGIAQIGNVLIGLAAGTKMGSDAILFYLLTYLFANLGAFAIIIAVSEAIGSEEIEDYSGLGRRSPFLAFSMLIFLLSLAGVPPLAGFIGKLYIFVAAIKEGLLHAHHRRAHQHRHFDVLLPHRREEDVHQRAPRPVTPQGLGPDQSGSLRLPRRHPCDRHLSATLHRLGCLGRLDVFKLA